MSRVTIALCAVVVFLCATSGAATPTDSGPTGAGAEDVPLSELINNAVKETAAEKEIMDSINEAVRLSAEDDKARALADAAMSLQHETAMQMQRAKERENELREMKNMPLLERWRYATSMYIRITDLIGVRPRFSKVPPGLTETQLVSRMPVSITPTFACTGGKAPLTASANKKEKWCASDFTYYRELIPKEQLKLNADGSYSAADLYLAFRFPYSNVVQCSVSAVFKTAVESTSMYGKRKGGAKEVVDVKVDCKVTGATLLHKYETGGILDLKWSSSGLLGQCNAEGHLCVYTYEPRDGGLVETCKVQLADDIVLSCDWDDHVGSSNGATNSTANVHCIVSSRDKALSYVDVRPSGDATVISQWPAHDFEPWITAFDYWNPDIVYSGGDDCVFMGWDVRMEGSMPLWKNRSHTMGVCSLHSHPKLEHCLISGSYDETVRFWDTRSMRSPLGESNIGGGLWRLKWHPTLPDLILTASMHNNFHILQTTTNQADDNPMSPASEAESIAMYTGHHGDLSYGVDWCRCARCLHGSSLPTQSRYGKKGANPTSPQWDALCGSCCFVTDNAVNLWTIRPDDAKE